MGSTIFTRHQYGLESTRGTAVAATRIMGAAPKAIPMDRQWQAIKLGNGSRAMYNAKRNDTLFVKDTITFDADHPLAFQNLPLFHYSSIDGTITPAEVTGGQSDYRWDVVPLLTAANAPKTFTYEMGDDVQEYEVEFCVIDNLKMAATIPADGSAAPVTGEFSYFGRQITESTFTAAQTLHSGLEFMNAKLSRLYLDSSWAGVGGTEITNILRGWELEIMTGNEPKFFGSANKYFDSFGEGAIGATLTLDLEGTSTADSSFYDAYRAGTELAIKLMVNGSQIGSGANYYYFVSLFGYFAEVVPLNQVIGSNNLHRALFVAKEDSSGNFMDIEISTNANTV